MRRKYLVSTLAAALAVALLATADPAFAGSVKDGGSGSNDLDFEYTAPGQVLRGGPTPLGGGLEVVWANGGVNAAGGARSTQCDQAEPQFDCNDLTCDNFGTLADDYLVDAGTVIRGVHTFAVFGGGEAPNPILGWIVTFYGGAFDTGEEPGDPIPDVENILDCFITTQDAIIAGEPGTTWEFVIIFEGGDGHTVDLGFVEWISVVPIADSAPQLFQSQSELARLAEPAQRFIPIDPDFHNVCDIVFDGCGAGFIGVAFDLLGEPARGGSNVMTIRAATGNEDGGEVGCSARLTPTVDSEVACNSGSCTASFGEDCYGEVGTTNGMDAETLATLLAANLQSKISSSLCNDQAPIELSVEAIGPRVILTTDGGPKPKSCVAVSGYTGVLGGLNDCHADGCNFHYQVGPHDDELLPTIGRGFDRLTTVKDCGDPVEGQGTWTTFDFPESFFDRPACFFCDPEEFPSKEMLGVQIPLSGVARSFAFDDSDTAVTRLDAIEFGRCSGDFTRPGGPANTRSPDGLVNELDQAAFDACVGNIEEGDCSFFDYDGDGDIDTDDGFVFDCLDATENNSQCCPSNLNVPQNASNIPTANITRLHLRACDLIQVARQDQNDWPENWVLDVYLSELDAAVGIGELGECTSLDQEPNDVINTAIDLGIVNPGEPQQVSGSISSILCDPVAPPPQFPGSHDADVYRFSLAFEERINARVAAAEDTSGCAAGPFGIISLYLYDDTGNEVAVDKGGFEGEGKDKTQLDPVISTVLKPGEYFLAVAAAGQPADLDPTAVACSVALAGNPFDNAIDPTGDYELNLSIAIRSTMEVTQSVYDAETFYGAGTFDSRILVQPLLAFSKLCDPFHTILVDSGNLEEDAVILEASDVPWVNALTDSSLVSSIFPGDPNFVVGVADTGGGQEAGPIQHVDPSGGEYQHEVQPPAASKCVTVENSCFFRQLPTGDVNREEVEAVINANQNYPLADDFTLEDDTLIGSVTFWVTPAGSVTEDDVFVVRVLGDTVLAGGCNGPDDSTVLSDGFVEGPFISPTAFRDADRVTVNITTPFTAVAGTRYWVVLAWDADNSPGATRRLFVTSNDLTGNGEFFHDLNAGSALGADGCIGVADGDGWDCTAVEDDPKTEDCDESDPTGDQHIDDPKTEGVDEGGDIALCLGPPVKVTAKFLPWDLACGQWRTLGGEIAWTQPYAVREDGTTGFFSDVHVNGVTGGRQAADSVTFFEEVTITNLAWRGLYTTNTVPTTFVDRFTVFYYNDENDLPSQATLDFEVLTFFSLDRVPGQFTGNPGRQIFYYSYTLSEPLVLAPETTIWISIVNDTTGFDFQWAWGTAQGGDSNGRAADRDILDDDGNPGGTWGAQQEPGDPPTDFSFDVLIKGTTKLICGDSVDCTVEGLESTASGLSYFFDPNFAYINGFQSKDAGDPNTQNRYRITSAPWKHLTQADVTPVSPVNAIDAFIEAGIEITQLEVDCLVQTVPGSKMVAAVFDGLADYTADIEVNGVEVTGTIERLCNGAVIEQFDPNTVLSQQLSVKGICWDNNTVTFLTHPIGGVVNCCLDGDSCDKTTPIECATLGGVPVNDCAADCAAGCAVQTDCNDNDVCTCDSCDAGACSNTETLFGNVGSPVDGSCDPSNVVDLDDILCVIAGFGTFADCPNADIAPPCTGNSIIDLDDILQVIAAFSGANPCGCAPEAPMTVPNRPLVPSDSADASGAIILVPSQIRIGAGDMVAVDVFVREMVDLRGYQVAVVVTGGRSGQLVLEEVFVDDSRRDFVFRGSESFQAVDATNVRLAGALLEGGTVVKGQRYLGTFVFRATEQASGRFLIVPRADTLARDTSNWPVEIKSISRAAVLVR